MSIKSNFIRRTAAAAAAALTLVSFAGCSKPKIYGTVKNTAIYEKYVDNVDALDVYYHFIYNIDSADIEERVSYGKDLYSRLSATVSTIQYSRDGDTSRLLYRERVPAVFFSYPEYEYYDGENYYYRYDGNWFADGTNRHAYYLTPDFLGIPSEIFTNYDITFNGLYRDGDEYILKIQGRHRETGMLCEITGYAGDSLELRRLEIVEEYESSGSIKQKHTAIDYLSVNEDIDIQPPASLDMDSVNYLK